MSVIIEKNKGAPSKQKRTDICTGVLDDCCNKNWMKSSSTNCKSMHLGDN